jgi:hypothetical protein
MAPFLNSIFLTLIILYSFLNSQKFDLKKVAQKMENHNINFRFIL